MALRLFQPFLILYLINRFKISSLLATQLIQRKHPIVLTILKKFIETWPILLNRAPTLHRMNIQSFKIRLVQGKAILLHPLVCSSYNADFDGDQMGIHIPITQQARAEAWKLLWSINNSIGLASRQPLFLPSQDMVIGNYYLTRDPLPFYQKFRFYNSSLISHDETNKTLLPKNEDLALLYSSINEIKDGPKVLKVQSKNSNYKLVKEKVLRQPFEDNKNLLPTINAFDYSTELVKRNFLWGEFSIEEAYQFYLNTTYRFHVNTPIWFRSFIKFETSEKEKTIEISIDKQGYCIYISRYYEMKLKRNRLLMNLNLERNSNNKSLVEFLPYLSENKSQQVLVMNGWKNPKKLLTSSVSNELIKASNPKIKSKIRYASASHFISHPIEKRAAWMKDKTRHKITFPINLLTPFLLMNNQIKSRLNFNTSNRITKSLMEMKNNSFHNSATKFVNSTKIRPKITKHIKNYDKEKYSLFVKKNYRFHNLVYSIQLKETRGFYFNPISIAQSIRSTFGRIEFYLHTS